MLSQEDYLMIKTLKKRGVYNKDIAAGIGDPSADGQPGAAAGQCTRARAPSAGQQARPLQAPGRPVAGRRACGTRW